MKNKNTRLSFTNGGCLIDGVSYPDIPLLIDCNNRIVKVASDWLRNLVVMRGRSADSVRQFAYHLKYWWEYLDGRGIPWDEVDDSIVITWRDKHLHSLDPGTVNGYISTIFRMYLWAESQGYTNGLIGERDPSKKIEPSLTVSVCFDRRGTCKFVSPLLKRTVLKPVLPTPTHDEITSIHQALTEMCGNIDLMVRDALVLTWAESTGARRMEVLSLKVTQIPSWDEIERLEESEEKSAVSIIGKGNKKRWVWVGADLLIQTLEYVENERNSVINRWRRRLGVNYKTPEEVFLSTKTGRRLHRDTISQKFALAFRKAGVSGSMHRVRARFLTDLTFAILEGELERLGAIPDAASLLLPVAEIAGHSNIETLAPYLAIAKKRMYRATKAERTAALKERAISSQRRVDINLTKLKSSEGARELIDAICSGKKSKIARALRQLCHNHQIDLAQPFWMKAVRK